ITRKSQQEPSSRYERGGYHPVSVGEIYNSHYTVVRQLGWGVYSTVWLVQDARDGTLASMKVLVGDLTDDRTGIDELGMLKTVHSRNPLSSGYPHICHLLDNFVHHGPNGDHRCLILEAMPFNMLEIHNAFRSASDAMPLFVIQRVAQQVLLALQYIHEECGLVHT
ncbi:kinase-like domain-containing protein, partial [Mucidula mucida]